jgi:molybdenum cofactor biosynthesis enzyme MoaA
MILFNKEIDLKTHYCQNFNDALEPADVPYVNVQVKIKGCNADCVFCEFKEPGTFDEDKYAEKLKLISDKVSIRKLNFTGGEPTLNIERLKRLIIKTKEIIPKVYIAINTNGYNFEKLFEEGIDKLVGNIQLSRHHYKDEINNKILGFNSVSKDTIKSISSGLEYKRLLNLSCNLINGYIDSKEEVFKYLDAASSMDVRWVGFVTLIPLNKYCEDNRIRFNDLNIFESERFIMTKHWKYFDKCQCFGYVYIPTDLGDPIRVYNKITEKSDIKNILVYDGENFTIGFSDDVLI